MAGAPFKLSREFLRTYEIRRIQSCMDGLKIAWLAHFFTVDSLPVDWIVMAALVFFLVAEHRASQNYKQISPIVADQLRKLFRLPSKYKFAISGLNNPGSHAITFPLSHWIVAPKLRYDSFDKSILAHEITHAKRWDSAVILVYTKISEYMWYVYRLFGIAALTLIVFTGTKFLNGVNPFMLAIIWASWMIPSAYIHFTQKHHLRRREFIADAEANLAFPSEHMEKMLGLKRRHRFRAPTLIENDNTHPPLEERIAFLQGAKRISTGTLLLCLFTVGFIIPFLAMNAATGYIYVPASSSPFLYLGEGRPQPEFDLTRFATNSIIQVYTLYLLSVITSIVTCGYKSGLSAWEKAACSVVFTALSIVGAGYLAFAIISASANYGPSGLWAYWLGASLALSPIFMGSTNAIITLLFRRPSSPGFIMAVSFLTPTIWTIGLSLLGFAKSAPTSSVVIYSICLYALTVCLSALPLLWTKPPNKYDGIRLAIHPLLNVDPKFDPPTSLE